MKKIALMIITVLLYLNGTMTVFADNNAGISIETARTEELIIVLDPGHDSNHGGAGGNGLREEKLNLKIAQYCMEELNTYNDVTVYMTRYTEDCPYPGAGGAGKDNKKRVEFAASVNADAYVSIHLNSLSDPNENGGMVFVPNKNYKPEIGEEGKGLGISIQAQLAALGIKDEGVPIRNSEDGTLYPDGSLADYYGVIKWAKELDMPGVIIEHCYISSPHDATNFLSSEEKLKALGVADATGIAEYYGLQKGGYEKIFDATYYADRYADLKELYGYDEAKLLKHFKESGMQEGRQAIASFDVFSYMGRYEDLRSSFGKDLKKYYNHYMYNGADEGRDGTFLDQTYTVSFVSEGKTIDTQMVAFGHGAETPSVHKDGYTYYFDKEYYCITEDTVVEVVYEKIYVPETESEIPTETEVETESETEMESETTIETEMESATPEESQMEDTQVSADVPNEMGVTMGWDLAILVMAVPVIVGILGVLIFKKKNNMSGKDNLRDSTDLDE